MEDSERYGIGELADAAGVSVRTVRYYIAEGLLPPAHIAGPRGYYTTDHLDRLRLIGRLKEAFLPLREIRRQLSGLDDEAIRALVDENEHVPPESSSVSSEESVERALAIDLAPSLGFIFGTDDIRSPRPAEATGSASEYIARVLRQSPAKPIARLPRSRPTTTIPSLQDSVKAIVAAPEAETRPEPDQPGTKIDSWRRIAIGDDAELLIREDAYQRRRDKVDWLVEWARKVLA